MGIASEGAVSCIVGKEALYMYTKDEARYQALTEEGEKLEELLHSTEQSEQDKQMKLMEYLNLLNNERAADLGVEFTERMLERIKGAFEAHPTADLAVDQIGRAHV